MRQQAAEKVKIKEIEDRHYLMSGLLLLGFDFAQASTSSGFDFAQPDKLSLACVLSSGACDTGGFSYICVTQKNKAMRYLRSTFSAYKEQAVKINFKKAAKVMLMSDNSFKNYRDNSGTVTYWGGLKEADESPLYLEIPSNGKWHVVIELGKFTREEMDGSVEMLSELPEHLKPIREIEAAEDHVEEPMETAISEEEEETA